jgi:SAM-dependent methyltransferase
MSDENAPSPGRHLLIAGTGRAGTSFLVRYLTELGLDTELSRHGESAAWDETANAGLETVPLTGQTWDLPYVLKFPWTDQMLDQILDHNMIRLDTVILPVRDLSEAAMSRSVVELQALHRAMPWMTELDQSWEMWGKTAGGVTFSLNPLDQGRLLAVGFHRLVERLVKADIPILFLAFPRMVEDWQYLFQKLRPVLPPTIDEHTARDAHQRASDPAKVRIGAELAGVVEGAVVEGASPAIVPAIHYASHQQLDAIAARRELAHVRQEAQVAANTNDRVLRDVRAQAEEAAEEALSLRRMMAATLQALSDEKDRVAASQREVAAAEHHVASLEHHLALVQGHLAAVQSHLARVKNHLELILTSRSWRLTRPYRRFVEIVHGWRDPQLRQAASAAELGSQGEILELPPEHEIPAAGVEGEIPEPVVAREVPESAEEHETSKSWVEHVIVEHTASPSAQPGNPTPDELSDSLTWTSRDTFLTKRFAFVMSVKRFDGRTGDGVVALLKWRTQVETYCRLLGELAPRRVLELGFFQGGMPLLMSDLVAPEKIVGVDRSPPSEALTAMIERAGLSQSIKLYGGIAQSDTTSIRQIVDAEFQGQPLDLIIDDASHEYELSKNAFEELFGYLRPGGKYVIEDWGWLHWTGEDWQTAKSPFWNQPALTNLVFEIIMALGSAPRAIIARIEIVSAACVVVTKGRFMEHGARLDLAATRLTCGRVYQLL